MSPGHAIALYQGQVLEVRHGVGQTGGDAPQVLCQVRLTTGAEVDNVRVIGPLIPITNTDARPSWCLVGYIAGNIDDPVLWPMVTAETRPGEWNGREVWLETSNAAMQIDGDGELSVRGRVDGKSNADAEADGSADWRLRIGALGTLFEMLGGGFRMARGTTSDLGAGDKIAIDAATSPAFAAWVALVTAVVQMAPGMVSTAAGANSAHAQVQVQLAAVQAQMAAIQAWSVAATPGALVIPPAAAAPAAPPAPPAAPAGAGAAAVPLDPVPAFGDQEAQIGVGFQVAGELRTGSANITGK